MSKNTTIITIVAVVVLLIGIVAFVTLSNNKKSSNTSNTTTNSQEASQSNSTTNGNIFTIATGGEARKCTYNYSGQNGTGTGTMYTDGKGRGLMQMSVETSKGNSGESSVLLNADKVYSWTTSNGKTVGFVFNKSTFEKQGTTTSPSTSSTSVDPSQKFDLKCTAWSVDEAILTVPSNVNFMSMPTLQQ